jgi:hypothetical protein
MKLKSIAHARSGDKGAHVNIGIIALDEKDYPKLVSFLTKDRVAKYFSALNPKNVVRYELPNLAALNFVLEDVLDGGASLNLRIDAQGKALGQALLEMEIES